MPQKNAMKRELEKFHSKHQPRSYENRSVMIIVMDAQQRMVSVLMILERSN